MGVTELARKIGVTPDTVRYYTRIGILIPVKNPENGYKYYSEKDSRRLHFVTRAKQLGFSVNEIQKIIGTAEGGDTPCAMVRDIVRARIVQAKQEIDELQRLHAHMQHALDIWQQMPDQAPSDHTICALIEQWDLSPEQRLDPIVHQGACP